MKKLLSIISFLHFALLRILYLGNTRVSVFPEDEEFLVMFDGLGCVALLFVDLNFAYHYSKFTFLSSALNLGSERTVS